MTGDNEPIKKIYKTLQSKQTQIKIVTTTEEGYTNYDNMICFDTGIVDKVYHDSYDEKRMEMGAVIAASISIRFAAYPS